MIENTFWILYLIIGFLAAFSHIVYERYKGRIRFDPFCLVIG